MSGLRRLSPLRADRRSLPLFIIVFFTLLAASVACTGAGAPTPEASPTSRNQDDATAVSEPTDTSPPAVAIAPVPTRTPDGVTIGVPSQSLDSITSIADVVTEVRPSVVSISVVATSISIFLRPIQEPGAGSGIIVGSNGYIVTNFHVIDGSRDITVTLPDGRTYRASVVGTDQLSDLAVIKIDEDDLPVASFGDSDSLRVGDWVLAMGNALNLKGGPTVTLGIISARGRTVTTQFGSLYDLIQTDAAINEGNSGGPLVDLSGQIIGVSSAILREAQGIGFGISSNIAVPIINSLIEEGRVARPLIGLNGQDLTPAIVNQLGLNSINGIVVSRVTAEGPASNAGLAVGDVIVGLDGRHTHDMGQFLTLLWTYDPGDTIQVEYVRDGQTHTTAVQLGER